MPEYSMSHSGKAVQIISIDDGKFKLNERELIKILCHPNAKEKPVSLKISLFSFYLRLTFSLF